MNYGNIKKYDIANGLGVRVSLFVSGCRVNCPHCFQKETWSFDYGNVFDDKARRELIDALAPSYIKGLSVLGGEPFEEENQQELCSLFKQVKKQFPNKDIWCYSGYIYDRDLTDGGRKHTVYTDEMLSYIDVLVDGPFILNEHNISLAFKGSANQRLIDLKATRESGSITLLKL